MFEQLQTKLSATLKKIGNQVSRLDQSSIDHLVREIRVNLLEADMNYQLAKTFCANLDQKLAKLEVPTYENLHDKVVASIQNEFANLITHPQQALVLNTHPTKILMVGLQGSGKTTFCVKLAHYLQSQQQKKVLLVGLDIYRPAAMQQLSLLATRAQIDCLSLENTPLKLIFENLAQKQITTAYDVIIYDTAGRTHLDDKLLTELKMFREQIKPQEILLTVDAMTGQQMINIAQAFHQNVALTGLVLTKIDGDARGGACLSVSQILNLPIKFLSSGEKITEIELFNPNSIANQILGLGDLQALTMLAKTAKIDPDQSQKMLQQIMQGKIDLDLLMFQLRQLKKMGSLKKVLTMLPGMQNMAPTMDYDQAQADLVAFEVLINSMTKAERLNPKLLKNPTRKQRVVRGSGRTVIEYNRLVSRYEMLKKNYKQILNKFPTKGF